MKKEQLVKPTKKVFCSYCGSQMLEDLVGAEKIERCVGYDMCCYNEARYDDETGKRQYAYKYTCPNGRKFFNPHDCFIETKIITFN